MERKIVIRTPENLEVTYELAGAGTRAAAYAVDVIVMFLVLNVFQSLLAALANAIGDSGPYLLAIMGILAFVYFNAYFMIFELIWAGQSPGKRLVGIRVIKTGGFALRFVDSLLRNLLRIIDFIPLFYGVGLVSLLATRRCQRIGDLVAGTLVVYQQNGSTEAEVSFSSPATEVNPLSVVKLGALPAELVETCDEYLRSREQLGPKYRQQIGHELMELVEQISGLSPADNQSTEAFLLKVVSQAGQIPSAI